MNFVSATAFVLLYPFTGALANSHHMGGLLDEAIGQVDDGILVEVDTEDSRHTADGLTVGAPPDIINSSHLLVAGNTSRKNTQEV